ncbi:MAG: beta-ketoacyl-ACP synthase III [Cyclobacteriaceae bacterium]|nr:beta-ketoacyl-ACP synthase III [Cyclobacteriaceae bacterium]
MPEVYITRTASFLPNNPIGNDEIEDYLGFINGAASRTRALILRNNKIKQRYYAMDKSGQLTHTNSEIAATAIRNLFEKHPDEIKDVELLSCATSSPDQIMPSHGMMVHGELPESGNMDVTSPSGNCCSGMHSLKYAYYAIKSKEITKAVTCASERLGQVMRHDKFEEEIQRLVEVEDKPILAFEKDFLRWMLSDGAGSFLIEDKKSETGISLRIDWIESVSFANQEEACMYQGCEKMKNGSTKSFKEYTPEEIINQSILSIKQDVKLLGEKIVALGSDTCAEILAKRGVKSSEIDHFLTHMSSFYFEDKIDDRMHEKGIPVPKEKWFTNLDKVGNVGSASIYIMIDELMKSGKLKKGEKILLSVPESARFSYAYSMLTVC